MVLLHDLASNARIWELAAQYLARRGLVLLAPDGRGHGLTDKPEGDYSFDTFCRDLLAFIEVSGLEKPVLVGYGWGANLALDYAVRFSFGPRAPAGIVLANGGIAQLDDSSDGNLPVSLEEIQQRLAPQYRAGTPLEVYLEQLGRRQAGWQPDEQTIPILLANYDIGEDETLTPRLPLNQHLQIARALCEFKTYERFQRVRCPVLLLPSQPPEPLSNAELSSLAGIERGIASAMEKIKDLQVRWMERADPEIPLQRPAELAELVADFIEARVLKT